MRRPYVCVTCVFALSSSFPRGLRIIAQVTRMRFSGPTQSFTAVYTIINLEGRDAIFRCCSALLRVCSLTGLHFSMYLSRVARQCTVTTSFVDLDDFAPSLSMTSLVYAHGSSQSANSVFATTSSSLTAIIVALPLLHHTHYLYHNQQPEAAQSIL
jgi:hypothetical protein